MVIVGMIGLSLVSLAHPAFSAATSRTATAASGPEKVEVGFRLQGSHGYSISAAAYSEEGTSKGTIEFIVNRHDESAIYTAPAIVTADALHADLEVSRR